ncbi:tetratricopeptide repeat-containing sensor histidine kinase [Lutibacter flavus]|uniref:tetratricopeptide repeat-containing sensor histidine kinase n=1 Tax=Lutibacter flavus TaxID=691689 RepID=UPI001130616A|nr:sensor histidine kinase [Lutibacter flavus]
MGLIISVYLLFSFASCEKEGLNGTLVNTSITSKNDSVTYWFNQSKSNKLTLDERKGALNKAYNAVNSKLADSIRLNYFSKIAYEAERLNSYEFFKKANFKNLALAKKVNNKLESGLAHWNYGAYYSKKEKIDSAYYHFHKAYEDFKSVNNEKYTARMLYNLGYIQGKIKDYTGSEISLYEAIAIYKKLKLYEDLYECYNYLGLIYMELEEFDMAIYYQNEALNYLEKVENKKLFKEFSLNNLGLILSKQRKYKESLEYFSKALNDNNLKNKNMELYAMLMDNIAYTKFLQRDTLNIEVELNRAHDIRDSLQKFSGVVVSKRHLSEYKAFQKDTISALNYLSEAYNLAGQVDNNRDKLATLLLLSKIDQKNSNKYLKEYVHLNDSLQIADRKTRNKFTRIRFETDEYIEETEKLSEQNLLITLGAFFTILILSLAYFLRVQSNKNKELRFEKEQQKTNQEIFSLMLKQQSKMEEGRLNERHRISEDLHDGVLGKIFGTRLGLGFLNITGDEATIKKHQLYIDELQNIEKEIRTISHELKSEILSSKENFLRIIKDLIEKRSNLGQFEYEFNYDQEINWNYINDEIKIHIYRIIQEALQNIIKYAKATNVEIRIDKENDNLNLFIKDNGCGFNVQDKRKGIGLKNMKSRAEKIEGIFKVSSVIGSGTTIYITCPINENYE